MFLFTHCLGLYDHHAFARLQTLVRGIWNERYKLKAGSVQKRKIKNNFVFCCPFWGYFIPLYLFWVSSYLSKVGGKGTYAISM